MSDRIIGRDKSIIIALDTDNINFCEKIVKNTHNIYGVGGYKPGFEMGLSYGLPKTVEVIRKHTTKPIIYDNQKAGNDIPKMGERFAKVVKNAGVDAVILFPFTGPESEKEWIESALEKKLKVIVGGWMTHKRFRRCDGGYLTDESIMRIFEYAATSGITDYVVPGNNIQAAKQIHNLLRCKKINPTFYPPGFITQGGSISEFKKYIKVKGLHPIIGEAIYKSKDMRASAIKYADELLK